MRISNSDTRAGWKPGACGGHGAALARVKRSEIPRISHLPEWVRWWWNDDAAPAARSRAPPGEPTRRERT
ncbi:hypothetical protein QP463_08355 [Actinotignum schaalii]|nr:hypothetical protein [Actinotignum schaalii]